MNEYLLEAINITKEFPGVLALDNVSFNLKKGEVHALLGENGAGKSTMMKIFSGVHKKDKGVIKIKGVEIDITSPQEASTLGIGIIYQELNLCPHLSVAENIFLSREFKKGLKIDRNKMAFEATKILNTLKSNINPFEKVKKLSISQKQIVEIAKALSQKAEIIIMDEPTSSLSEHEVSQLFQVIKELKNNGKGIIYISHKLDELKEIVDRVTVFRDGKYVDTDDFSKISLDDIISKMVGRNIKDKFPRINMKRGDEIMSLRNFNKDGLFNNINFNLYKGEILGIAGLVGAGRTELSKGIFGAYGECSGSIKIDGEKIVIKSPIDAINNGISYVAEDRKGEGLAINMNISQNISFPILREISSNFLGYINKNKLNFKSTETIKNLLIKTPSPSQKVKNLSGGNQQKIVIGKWLLKNPKIIIFDEPTRGIDINAKIEIYKIINNLKERGVGVIMISSELPELLGISDRILIMCNKEIKGEVITTKTTQEEIMNYATKFN